MTVVPGIDRVTLSLVDGVSLVRITGTVDVDMTRDLREALTIALQSHDRLIVDLSRAESLDSVGLSTLLAAGRAARRCGGELLLAAPSRVVRSVLQASRLDIAFAVFDTVPRAITVALDRLYAEQKGAVTGRRLRERDR